MNELDTWNGALNSLLYSVQDDSAEEWEVEIVRTRVNNEIKQLQAERDRYKEALEFYANKENWGKDDWGVVSVMYFAYEPAQKALGGE